MAVLAALGVWLALLAIAFAGGWVGAPAIVGQVAIAIWAGAGMFLIPASWLLALLIEEGIARRSQSWHAVHMAPYLLVAGSLVLGAGVLLLLPSSSATIPLRLVGGWAVAWGGFALFVGVTALRKKRRTRVDTRP
ncbi:MAG TPA: hypothetical protein VGX27_08215 [Candidatus Dormibacteraeota bacterium]|nr:hypothetical protein [Candidatus Dormibacteraeota bacterium]